MLAFSTGYIWKLVQLENSKAFSYKTSDWFFFMVGRGRGGYSVPYYWLVYLLQRNYPLPPSPRKLHFNTLFLRFPILSPSMHIITCTSFPHGWCCSFQGPHSLLTFSMAKNVPLLTKYPNFCASKEHHMKPRNPYFSGSGHLIFLECPCEIFEFKFLISMSLHTGVRWWCKLVF